MRTYTAATEAMATARSAARGKPLHKRGNTRLETRDGGALAVRYHATDVVTYHPDGRIVLRDGGWRTVTTKARMNEYAPGNVWCDRGVWYVGGNWHDKGSAVVYCDGMTVHPDGRMTDPDGEALPTREEAKTELAAGRKFRKAVGKYARDFTAAIMAGDVGMPDGGDCWHCHMHTQDGKSLGEATRDGDHIRGHVEESYHVPSLVWNAMGAMGASQAVKHSVAVKCGAPGADGQECSFFDSVAARDLPNIIRRYCLRELGMSY